MMCGDGLGALPTRVLLTKLSISLISLTLGNEICLGVKCCEEARWMIRNDHLRKTHYR
jgi:hypothetical protein